MKKLVVTVLTLLTCGSTYALPIGNPAEASLFLHGTWFDKDLAICDPCYSWYESWNFRVGYCGDFVFNRHLGLANENHEGEDIEKTEIFTNASYFVLNVYDRIDAFLTLGASNITIKTDARSWDFPGSLKSDLFFRTDFSWSAGARATLWGCDCFFIGLEGQYFQINTDFDHFIAYDTGTIIYFNGNNDASYSEWQIGLGAAYRFAAGCPTLFAMVPYAAIKWSGSRLVLGNFTFTRTVDEVLETFTFHDLKNKKFLGLVAGISLTVCDSVGVTVEGRWADEKAIYVVGQFRL